MKLGGCQVPDKNTNIYNSLALGLGPPNFTMEQRYCGTNLRIVTKAFENYVIQIPNGSNTSYSVYECTVPCYARP